MAGKSDFTDPSKLPGEVYLLQNRINGKVYIGKTLIGTDARWRQHIASARKGYSYALYFAIRKYGLDAFTRRVVAIAEDEEQLAEFEIALILRYQSFKRKFGYNMTFGGEGHSVPLHQRLFGEKNPYYGKKHSRQIRAKIKVARERQAVLNGEPAIGHHCINPFQKGHPDLVPKESRKRHGQKMRMMYEKKSPFESITCLWCQHQFKARPRFKREFCSRECASHRYELRFPEEIKTCPGCGGEVHTRASLPRKYCSHLCAMKAITAAASVKHRREVSCVACGKQISRPESHIKGRICFCSWACYCKVSGLLPGRGRPNRLTHVQGGVNG